MKTFKELVTELKLWDGFFLYGKDIKDFYRHNPDDFDFEISEENARIVFLTYIGIHQEDMIFPFDNEYYGVFTSMDDIGIFYVIDAVKQEIHICDYEGLRIFKDTNKEFFDRLATEYENRVASK
jgi:hypothetical protein